MLIGIAHNLEEVAMTFILPEWTFDVKTMQDAWAIRQQALKNAVTQHAG